MSAQIPADRIDEWLVEQLRGELRSSRLQLTPTERAEREVIVDDWERGELAPEELRRLLTAIWSEDWPLTGLTRFLRKIHLDGLSFAAALEQADAQTLQQIERVFADGYGDEV